MKGFTLIELMVTITILLVLSGTSISAYLTFNKSQSVDTDARQLVSEINRVRSLASNNVYPAGCNTLTGYNIRSVDVNGVKSGVLVTAKCSPADIVGLTDEILLTTYFSSPTLTTPLAFDLTFSPGNGYLTIGDNVEISIRDTTDPTVLKRIVVGAYSPAYINL